MLSKPPSNIDGIHKHSVLLVRLLRSPESKQYVRRIEGARNEAISIVEMNAELLKEFDDDGYDQAIHWLSSRRQVGSGLSAPQPVFIEGLEMQEYRPFSVDERIKGMVLYEDDPYPLTLPHLAGDWKGRGKDIHRICKATERLRRSRPRLCEEPLPLLPRGTLCPAATPRS